MNNQPRLEEMTHWPRWVSKQGPSSSRCAFKGSLPPTDCPILYRARSLQWYNDPSPVLEYISSTHEWYLIYRGILTLPGLTKKIFHWIRLLIHHLGLSFPQVFLSSGMAVKTAKQVVAWGSTTVVEEATSHKICPELSPRHSRAAPCLSSHPHCLNRFVYWDLNQINLSGANNSITDVNDTTYDKVSDVVESWVGFASKTLMPDWMH